MADAGAKMESWFSWEEHFLDFLLFFWIFWAVLIVAIVNAVLTFFGPLQPRISWDKSKAGGQSATTVAHGPTGPESTFWLNSALNWFYLHYNKFPEFVDAWVISLNDQVNKLGGPVQLRFEKVQSGSLPPKFGEVKYDAGPEDKFDINCLVDSHDISFAVFASQQTHEGVKLTNLTVNILKLKGHLKIHCFRKGKDMMATAGFSGRPDIKVVGKPVNPYLDPLDMVDIGVTEEVVRNAICLASTTFNVSKWIEGTTEESSLLPPEDGSHLQRQRSNEMKAPENLQQHGSHPVSPRQAQQQAFEPIEIKETSLQQQQQHSAFQVPTVATPTKSPAQRQQMSKLPSDKRLLAKVIKASGLKQGNSGSMDPYCVVYVDNPPQSEVTSVVKSSLNPFWDEQFYFDLTPNSQEIRFEILDKKRPQNENFLGEALVYCEDLQKNPSSRQIIPLQGRLGAGEFVSGSITVEFLCMDPSYDLNISNQISPRRMIETSKSVTPGGTLVTTTTTTTHRPQNHRIDANVDSSPSYIEKRGFDYDEPDPELSSSEVVKINGVESVTETALRALSERSRNARTPTKTSTLIITGVKREPVVPVIKTIESSPTESSEGRPVMPSPESPTITYTQQQQPKEKKKSFAQQIKKRFSRSKKRSLSADRASSSLREGSNYLKPPDQGFGPQSKDWHSSIASSETSITTSGDDIDLHKQKHDIETPNLKKSRSLGGSLKKLFRRSRKRSRSIGKGEQSRESSVSRQSRHLSEGPSREGSLTRASHTSSHQETVVL